MNPMREIRIEKVTINIGAGEAGVKLDIAKKLLEKLTNKKVLTTKTSKRTTFGTPKGRPIGVKVTLRGKEASEFLKRALDALDFKLNERVFDKQGNFSFGIKEHIDIPGVKYDPEIGIYGMDISVTLERRGFKIKRKRISHDIGKHHLITPGQAKEWAISNLGVRVE
jgi:large subunit ribosomal protein L5